MKALIKSNRAGEGEEEWTGASFRSKALTEREKAPFCQQLSAWIPEIAMLLLCCDRSDEGPLLKVPNRHPDISC